MIPQGKSIEVRNLTRKIDFSLLAITILLISFGILMIYSTSANLVKGDPFYYARKQAFWFFLGAILLVAAALFNYSQLRHYTIPIYITNLFLLLLIFILAKPVLGAQRWIEIASFRFQPSEFAKLGMIITLAAFLAKRQGEMRDLRNVFLAASHIIPLTILVVLQPDLGTALVFVTILLGMLVAAGVEWRHLLLIILVGYIMILIVFQFQLLQDYQMQRLRVFLNPGLDPLGSGYNLRQSMIAIGSGEIIGKGLFRGTQSRLNFIPERHTDFIFSVVGEELGFIGSSLLVFGFFLLLIRTLGIAASSRNFLGLLIATGIASMWFFQVLINIGMTIGIMPVTGIPLPFVSYGGSSLLTNSTLAGLLLSIYRHRFR